MTPKKVTQQDTDKTIVADLLERNGIYWLLTELAVAVRTQGKLRQKAQGGPQRLPAFVILAEGIAKSIEKARDAT